MQNTTLYEFGDVVLVPFPLAEFGTVKKQRPAVVISSSAYNAEAIVISTNEHADLIVVIGLTSVQEALGAVDIKHWRQAGLLHPSAIKPTITTLAQARVVQRLGKLSDSDKNRLKRVLMRMLNLTAPNAPARPA